MAMDDILAFVNENFEKFIEYLTARGVPEDKAEKMAKRQVKELEETIYS